MWYKNLSNNARRDFRLPIISISYGNIKYAIGKSNFAVNLKLKLVRVTDANALIGNAEIRII